MIKNIMGQYTPRQWLGLMKEKIVVDPTKHGKVKVGTYTATGKARYEYHVPTSLTIKHELIHKADPILSEAAVLRLEKDPQGLTKAMLSGGKPNFPTTTPEYEIIVRTPFIRDKDPLDLYGLISYGSKTQKGLFAEKKSAILSGYGSSMKKHLTDIDWKRISTKVESPDYYPSKFATSISKPSRHVIIPKPTPLQSQRETESKKIESKRSISSSSLSVRPSISTKSFRPSSSLKSTKPSSPKSILSVKSPRGTSPISSKTIPSTKSSIPKSPKSPASPKTPSGYSPKSPPSPRSFTSPPSRKPVSPVSPLSPIYPIIPIIEIPILPQPRKIPDLNFKRKPEKKRGPSEPKSAFDWKGNVPEFQIEGEIGRAHV